MIGERSLFQYLQTRKNVGTVTFEGNQKGIIMREGNVGKVPHHVINKVLLVKGLKHNLVSISQLCDSGLSVSFDKDMCNVIDKKGKTIFRAKRQGNLYKINLENLADQNVTCLVSSEDNKWLWHRKLEHASLWTITRIVKHDLVCGLPNFLFKSDIKCSLLAYKVNSRKALLN